MQGKRIAEMVLYLALLGAGILYLARGQAELPLPRPAPPVAGSSVP